MGFPTKNDQTLGCEMRVLVPPFKETPIYRHRIPSQQTTHIVSINFVPNKKGKYRLPYMEPYGIAARRSSKEYCFWWRLTGTSMPFCIVGLRDAWVMADDELGSLLEMHVLSNSCFGVPLIYRW